MGTFASGDVQIYFKSEKDASKVHEILSNENVAEEIQKIIGKKGQGDYTLYDFEDSGSDSVCFSVCSDRVENAEWQVENIVKLLTKLVTSKEIEDVVEFQAELLTQHSSWYMSEGEFGEGGDCE